MKAGAKHHCSPSPGSGVTGCVSEEVERGGGPLWVLGRESGEQSVSHLGGWGTGSNLDRWEE
jgi:hypothetical protein